MVPCLCGESAIPLIQRDRETAVAMGESVAKLHVCQGCGHVFFHPFPTEMELADYYKGPWNAGANFRIEDSFEQWIEKLDGYEPQRTFVNAIIRLRAQHFGSANPVVIHDASCGYGALVTKLNMIGFDASGSDIDDQSIQIARSRGNLRVHRCHFRDMSKIIPDGVDIITSYHSVEHYINPLDFFRTVKSCLRKGGVFLMSVPNGAYLPARLDYFKEFDWCFYPGHLQYFTPYSASVLLAKAGLRVTETFSYGWDWPASQTDWLVKTMTGLLPSQLPAPERLVQALAENVLTRDLRVVAMNDDVRVEKPLDSQHRYIEFARPQSQLLATTTMPRNEPDLGAEADTYNYLREAAPTAALSSRKDCGDIWPLSSSAWAIIVHLIRTAWILVSPRALMRKCTNLALWLRATSSVSALATWHSTFDASYYLQRNSDIRGAGVDPFLHFLLYGGLEGRNPSSSFDALDYISRYPDVRSKGINPLLHFVLFGRSEHRKARPVGSESAHQ